MVGCRKAPHARRLCGLHIGLTTSSRSWIAATGARPTVRLVVNIEPVAAKCAFGWETMEIDGNSIDQIVNALRCPA